MTINKTIIRGLERMYRKTFPNDLKRYLLIKYAHEPFPYEFSEQDLYTNIEKDMYAYNSGELDLTVKSPSKRWKEEREYLHNLYIEKCRVVRDFEEYIAELEHILSEHGLQSSRIAKQQIEY